MNMNQALLESGVRDDTLSVAERDFLDLNGYLPLGRILTPEQIANMIRRLDKLAELEGEDAGKELHQEGGTIRVSNLVNKGPMFEIGLLTSACACRHTARHRSSVQVVLAGLPDGAARTRAPSVSRGLAFGGGSRAITTFVTPCGCWTISRWRTARHGLCRVPTGAVSTPRTLWKMQQRHPAGDSIDSSVGNRHCLQFASLARWRIKSNRFTTARDARLLLPPRS